MKPEVQAELKSCLIKQYSRLCYTKCERLISNLEQVDWWEKEKHRIKIQYTVACVSFIIILVGFFIVIARYASNGISLATALSSIISILIIFNNIDQRRNTFKMLELIKEDIAHKKA